MNEEREWYVVRTKPRRERYAQEQLCRRGVETFLPRIVEPSRAGSAALVAALFPSYLFARIDLRQQYARVVWTPGVRHLVAFGETPTPVEQQVIDFIHGRCGAEGIVRVQPTFRDGDLVRVTHGPMAGLVGVVDGNVSGRHRVQVLMELLKRRTRVTVPVQLLVHTSSPYHC